MRRPECQDDNPTRIKSTPSSNHKAAVFLLHSHHQQLLQSPLFTFHDHSEAILNHRHPISQFTQHRTTQDRRVYDDYRKPQNYRSVIPGTAPCHALSFCTCFARRALKRHCINHEHRFPFSLTIPRARSFTSRVLTILTDPFAEADEDTGQVQQSQSYIHIRIQRMFVNTPLR